MNITQKIIAAAAILVGSTGAMASSLVGDTMTYQYHYPDLSTVYSGASNGSFVVGSGVEVGNIVDGAGTLDVQASQIVIDFTGTSWFNGAAFNGWTLTSSTAGAFGSVTIDAATTDASFAQSMISITGDTLSVNWQGTNFTAGQQIVLDVTPAVSAVPEASNAAMLLAGLLVTAGIARRRRSA